MSNSGVQSVERAVSLLQAIARHGNVRVTDLAAEIGVHKSTASRLLATLEDRGLVEQDGARGSYRLGQGILQLAGSVSRHGSFSALARPVCEELAAAVGETVNVSVLDGTEVVTIDQVIGGAVVAAFSWVGHRSPLHATAAGKAFLASFGSRELSAALKGPLRRYTPATIVDRRALRAELEEVRRRGYSVVVEEHEVGLNAVGAAVRNAEGAVAGAITVAGPAYRLGGDQLPTVGERVAGAAGTLSRRSGYAGAP